MFDGFSFEGFVGIVIPLFLCILGIVIYAIFIYHFYRFLALKNIFHLDLGKKNSSQNLFSTFFSVFFYVLEYLLILPLFIFLWFVIIVLVLVFMSGEMELGRILLFSMALIASVRVCAYYHENLAKDLAKLLPLSFLAFFLINPSWPSFLYVQNLVIDFNYYFLTFFYYFIFVFMLELFLRIITFFKNLIFDGYYKDV